MTEDSKKSIKVLDTTLRDGSYALNFQFTAKDTTLICQALESAGVELIEVGHGVGLNASARGLGKAIETDEAYLKAAAEGVTSAKFGVFCIPGIARLEDVDLAASYGCGFIRIGTNVADVHESEQFIKRAKKHGMKVSANFMKSYASPPSVFVENAKISASFGSDLVCLVDSAGGMMPWEVERYVEETKSAVDLEIGFHGHDNLGLAVANSLTAIRSGASVVDGSMQGFGRSAGNTPTETLVMSLLRSGYQPKIDYLRLMDHSEKFVRPLIQKRGISAMDVITGFSLFHSSYMGIVKKKSAEHGVDPRRLIIAVSEREKSVVTEELVDVLVAA